MTPAVVLSVAGTDSGGAAGLAADLATFAAHGTHGALVVTAVTAQDTTGVHAIHVPPYDVVAGQLDAVLDDLPVAAAKTGMLGSPETVRLAAERLGHLLLVVDPVLVATSGAVLGNEAVRAAYVDHLLPVATVITPNLDEAKALLACDGAPDQLAAKLSALGPAVVLTGGFETLRDASSLGSSGQTLAGARSSTTESEDRPAAANSDADTGLVCTDWLALPGEEPVPFTHPALPTTNDHGTGCTFSAALAALLARGLPIPAAIRRAAAYTSSQLALSRRWDLGRGRGPIAHLTPLHHRHEETS